MTVQTAYRLQWPPSANTYYRHVVMGKRAAVLLSAKGREYQNHFCPQDSPILGRLRVSIMLHPPDRRKFDIDNRIKPLLDCLQACNVIEDDGQVDELVVKRGPIRPNGEALVLIEVLECTE